MIYKFTHTEDYSMPFVLHNREELETEWISFKNHRLTIKGSNRQGYSWDGCSPKVKIFGRIIGTPDGRIVQHRDTGRFYPATYYASMVHDCIYQHKAEIDMTRLECDRLFKQMLISAGFRWWRLYYFGVRAGGWIYGKWRRR